MFGMMMINDTNHLEFIEKQREFCNIRSVECGREMLSPRKWSVNHETSCAYEFRLHNSLDGKVKSSRYWIHTILARTMYIFHVAHILKLESSMVLLMKIIFQSLCHAISSCTLYMSNQLCY